MYLASYLPHGSTDMKLGVSVCYNNSDEKDKHDEFDFFTFLEFDVTYCLILLTLTRSTQILDSALCRIN
jgi:hypothetical protein